MELQDFIKTKKTQKFLETTHHWIRTKNYVLVEIEEKIQDWVADGCSVIIRLESSKSSTDFFIFYDFRIIFFNFRNRG